MGYYHYYFGLYQGNNAYDKFVNGALTIGENIADIGGLKISYYAFLMQMEKDECLVTENMKQTFFKSWARNWRNHFRKETALQRIVIDPHSPPNYRVNVVVSNLKEFIDIFEVKFGDGLYNPNAISIW